MSYSTQFGEGNQPQRQPSVKIGQRPGEGALAARQPTQEAEERQVHQVRRRQSTQNESTVVNQDTKSK